MMARVLRRSRAGATSLVVALVGLSAACSSRQVPVSASGSGPETAPAVDASETRDYATQRAAWIITHQPDEPNRWAELTNELARVQGAWNHFVVTNADVRAWEAIDPEKREERLRPLMVFTPEAEVLLPAVLGFVQTLNTMKTWEILTRLSADGSFVAARPVEPLLDEMYPETTQSWLVVQLLAVRMRLAQQAGDIDLFISSLDQGRMLARAVGGRGLMLNGLVSLGIDTVVLAEVKRAVLAGSLDRDACERVLDALAARPEPMDMGVAFGGERFYALDAIERFFDKVNREVAAGDLKAPPDIMDRGLGIVSPKAEQLRLANKLFDGAVQSCSVDRTTRAVGLQAMDEVMELVDAEDSYPRLQPLSLVIPPFEQTRKGERRHRVELGGVRVMLALEMHKSRTGHFPESLDALVPVLGQIPSDPYGADQPLRYRRSENAEGYVLYTVGLDGEDNQGQEHPQNAQDAVGSLTAKGYDFVINKVRD